MRCVWQPHIHVLINIVIKVHVKDDVYSLLSIILSKTMQIKLYLRMP